VVSHDRYLLERMTDRQMALLGDGTLRDLPGGVEQYLDLRSRMRATTDGRPGRGPAAPAVGAPASDASGVAGASAYSPAQVREARKTLTRVERALDRIHAEEAALHDQMAAAATDPQRLSELTETLALLTEQEESLELEWLEASEAAQG
jgi:hypothetical protein